MTGTILGFDINANEGAISGDDNTRYKFTKSAWRDIQPPIKELKVDFNINEAGEASDIYIIRNSVVENTSIMMGLLAVIITFFFGFIGTLVSLVVIAKEPVEESIIPTIIHLIVTLFILLPFFGWFIYFIGTVFFMIKNYSVVMNKAH